VTGKKPKTKPLPAGFSIQLRASIEARFNLKGLTVADGILAKVISKRGSLKRVVIVGKKETSFLVTDGNGNYAHGKTAREAMSELAFKLADKGDLSDLADMPLDTEKTAQEWAFVYRRATGACKTGTENFMSQRVKKKTYTLAEILEETKDAFGGSQFRSVVGAS
jgi:hypothetical protein